MFRKLNKALLYPFETWFIWTLLIINILGSIYGYYWYRYQLAETPWYYWPFVPDSPLSSTLFSLVLITILLNKRSKLLELWAYCWVIKYGIWAVLINLDVALAYRELFGWENLMLALSHGGMAVEGFLFLRHLKVSKVRLAMVVFWMIVNDLMDYGVGLHPYLFDANQINLARISAVTLTAFLALIGYYLVTPNTRE